MNGCKAQGPALSLGRVTNATGLRRRGSIFTGTRPATRDELFALFEHLEGELDRSGFLRPPEKRPSMVRAIRNMFHRMGADRAGRPHLARDRCFAQWSKQARRHGGGVIVLPRFCYCDGP